MSLPPSLFELWRTCRSSGLRMLNVVPAFAGTTAVKAAPASTDLPDDGQTNFDFRKPSRFHRRTKSLRDNSKFSMPISMFAPFKTPAQK